MNAPAPLIQPLDHTTCYGTCCPVRGNCKRYLAVEQRADWTPVVDTCIDGGGRYPLHTPANTTSPTQPQG